MTNEEKLQKDVDRARKAASTWQSKYQSLKNEFEDYKCGRDPPSDGLDDPWEETLVADGPDIGDLPPW